jgi:predicted HTH domain antitoxin
MEVKVSLPEDVARFAGLAGRDAPEQARFLLLLELYREGRVSLGRFAELAGVSQAELLDRMGEHGTYLNYSLKDLEDDRKNLP